MVLKKLAVIFMFTFFVLSECDFVDDLPKCHLDDDECLRNLYQNVVRSIGSKGIPKLNIPPIDPIRLHNVSVSVLNLLNITLIDGVAKGIKNCVFQKFSINITAENGHQENECDITIKGHYNIYSDSQLLETLLGKNAIKGEGNGKIKIEKLHLNFDFPFYIQKRDGEHYIKCLYDDIKYTYTIGGVTTFFADNLYIGDEELSRPITDMLNSNSEYIMSAFGQPFIDKAVRDFYFKFAGDFFDNVPMKYYIIENVSSYAKP